MKSTKLLTLFCLTAFLIQVQPTAASIDVDYYRLPPAEREKVTHDQATWKTFEDHLIQSRFQAEKDALDKLKLNGLSGEERARKIDAALKAAHNPAHFNLEKDWHIIAYLLTGDASMKEENLPNAP